MNICAGIYVEKGEGTMSPGARLAISRLQPRIGGREARRRERAGNPVFTCAICQFEVELDDVALPGRNGLCVCLRCYQREAGTMSVMPKELRRELTLCLEETAGLS
jgi:hypothetical protein